MASRGLFILLCLFCIFPLMLIAQIGQPGSPPSFNSPELTRSIPVEQLVQVDTRQMQVEDQQGDTLKDIPWRFGTEITVNLNPENSGTWDLLPGNHRLWRMGIASQGAYSLNLVFNKYRLPPGAQLFIYNADRSFVLGAFTDFNNQQDGSFATSLLPGDSVFIEYFEPHGVDFHGELNLETIVHGYRDLLRMAKGFGDSGWCNMNVACPESRGWDDQVNSAVLMIVGGFVCSAVLVNNTNNDGSPYVLSANHCYGDPSKVVLWFNWQSGTCNNPFFSPPHQSMSGAVNKSRNATSDFWLLEMNQTVPENYKPYFAGWNRSLENELLQTVTGIHHPRGDIKKYSYATQGVQASSFGGGPGTGTSYWRIEWSGATTTEQGSSGSPIFDAQGRILGQLHGGYASCGNTLPDWYGRFGTSWTGSQSPETRLMDWLDPLGLDPPHWEGMDPFGEPIVNPSAFRVQTVAADTMALSWQSNQDLQPVMIAMNTSDEFGTPKGAYSLGDEIAGGGTILFLGESESYEHHLPDPSLQYYYKAWSFSPELRFSPGTHALFQISCEQAFAMPFTEDFETATMPHCWLQQTITGNTLWQTGSGNNAGNPSEPFSGEYNAFFRDEPGNAGNTTQLILPAIDTGNFEMVRLSFYHFNAANHGVSDILEVMVLVDDNWEVFQTLDQATDLWTRVTLDFPVVGSEIRLAFQAQANGGQGIGLDLIEIHGYQDVEFPAPGNLLAMPTANDGVNLSWQAPLIEGQRPLLTGFLVYRNDDIVAVIPDPFITTFSEGGLPIGIFDYYITAIYEDPAGESLPSNLQQAAIQAGAVQHTLTLNATGSGSTHPAAGVYEYNEGIEVAMAAIAPLHWGFSHWEQDGQPAGDQPEMVATMDRDRLLTAVFISTSSFEVTLSSFPEGIGQQSGGGTFSHGQSTTISTTTPNGWKFSHWKNNGNMPSTKLQFPLIVTTHSHLTAYFTPTYWDISLQPDPPQGGSVSGGGNFIYGTNLTVVATPSPDWYFLNWRIDGEVVSTQEAYAFDVTDHRMLTAHFSTPLEVIAQVLPQGSGSLSGAGIYQYGSTATLTAYPNTGWRFIGWEENGQILSGNTRLSFQVLDSRSFLALMQTDDYTLDIALEGEGSTIPQPGSYTQPSGYNLTLDALPADGWIFSRWEINGIIHEQPSVEVSLIENISAKAFFQDTNVVTPEQDLLVFPVPATNVLNILVSNQSGLVRIDLLNLNGQQIRKIQDYSASGGEYQSTMDLQGVRAGIYILRMVVGNTTTHRKVVVH